MEFDVGLMSTSPVASFSSSMSCAWAPVPRASRARPATAETMVLCMFSPFGTGSSVGALEDRERAELVPQDGRRLLVLHPALDQRRVDAPVVGGVFEVAVVEVGEARHLAVLPAGDRLADDEGRAGSAVV